MRTCLLPLLLPGILHGAVIKGTVLENQTGHLVARATITLDPIAGVAGSRRTAKTSTNGFFEFTAVPAGTYLVTASRTGFAPAQYGQKRWKSAGMPVTVAEDESPTLAIRLPHYGAITGTILDENDVGLPDHDVLAYRFTRPPQLAGRARSDDRGVYRVPGLEPGSYVVRTAGKQYDDISYVPTFGRETQSLDQVFPVQVEMDGQTERADIRPQTGRLYMLTVEAVTFPPNPTMPLPVTLTLASELGRQTVQASTYRFGPLPEGQYEIYAEAPLDRRPGLQGDYRKISVNHDTAVGFILHEQQEIHIKFAGDGVPDPGTIQVLARRSDLAGPGRAEVLKIANGRISLAVGPWQLAIQPDPAFAVAAFSGPGSRRTADTRADGWNDIQVGFGGPLITFTLATNPSVIHGTVQSNSAPVAGAPVFLEPVDMDPQRRIAETFTTITDIRGQYRFGGLSAGLYRVVSSFDNAEALTTAGVKPFRLEKAQDLKVDLDLYTIP